MMKTTSVLIFAAALLPLAADAGEKGKLIFEDDFEREESQEKKDEPGNGWTTSSDTRAGGNKQVDLKDGAMYIYMHETGDHAVSVRHEFKFKDGSVELKFMLENEGDTLGLNFADMSCKEVHAGHLFMVTVGSKSLDISDKKTGVMDLKIRALRKENKLTPEMQKDLATKKKKFPVKVKKGKWHDLAVSVEGDTVAVSLDGKEVGEFSSEGFDHPTKGLLRLSVPKRAVVDDLKIYSRD